MACIGVRVPPVLTCSVSVVVSTCCGRDGVVTRSAMQWSSLGKNTVSREWYNGQRTESQSSAASRVKASGLSRLEPNERGLKLSFTCVSKVAHKRNARKQTCELRKVA